MCRFAAQGASSRREVGGGMLQFLLGTGAAAITESEARQIAGVFACTQCSRAGKEGSGVRKGHEASARPLASGKRSPAASGRAP